MEVAEIDRRHQDRSTRLIEEMEKIVEDLQQRQLFYLERKFPEKKLHLDNAKSKANYTLDYGWTYGEKWIHKNSELDRKKMELEKLTFAHGAYRDKKAVLSFSSEEPEVNIHRIWRLNHDLLMKWRLDSISDRERVRKKLMELVMERDHLFINSPIKGFLWNLLPSKMDLRNHIQTLEITAEEKRKVFSKRRKEMESNKRELRKAENEIKSLRNAMLKLRQRKQKALQNLVDHNELF